MRSNPYRLAAEPPPADPAPKPAPCDVDLAPILLILWTCSVVRVALALTHHETFGAELTLAAMAVLGLPFLGRELLADLLARAFGRLAPTRRGAPADAAHRAPSPAPEPADIPASLDGSA